MQLALCLEHLEQFCVVFVAVVIMDPWPSLSHLEPAVNTEFCCLCDYGLWTKNYWLWIMNYGFWIGFIITAPPAAKHLGFSVQTILNYLINNGS